MTFQTAAHPGHCILKGMKKGQTEKQSSEGQIKTDINYTLEDQFGQDLTIWHCVKIKGDSHNVL